MTTTLTHPRPSPPSTNGHRPASLVRGRSVNRARRRGRRSARRAVHSRHGHPHVQRERHDARSWSRVERSHRATRSGLAISDRYAVSSQTNINAISADRSDELVGRTAAFTIPEGALVTSTQVGDGPPVPTNSEMAGAIVKPGQFPVGLRVGDQVRLIESAAADAATGVVEGHERGTAVVTDLKALDDGSGGIAISLAVPNNASIDVASAGAAGRLSLVVVEHR